MSLTTQSRVFPVSSLIWVNSLPISLPFSRRRSENDSSPRRSVKPSTRPACSSSEASAPGSGLPCQDSDQIDASISEQNRDISSVSTPQTPDRRQTCEHDAVCTTHSIQAFGAAIGLEQDAQGNLLVSMSSDNSKVVLGYSPSELFALQNFCDLLDDHESDALLDHITSAHDRASYSSTLNVFDLSIRGSDGLINCFSCVMHADTNRPSLLLCEFVPQCAIAQGLVPAPRSSPHQTQRMQSRRMKAAVQTPTDPGIFKRPRRGSAASTLSTMSRAQESISVASSMESLLENLVRSIKIATGHSQVSIHRFDDHWNGRLVAQSDGEESFECFLDSLGPASCNLSPESRMTFETSEVQVQCSQDQGISRLVHRPAQTLGPPLETGSLRLRVLPKFSINGVDQESARSRVLIPLMIFGKLWGVVVSHTCVPTQAPITFLSRGLCRLIADSASTKMENLVTSQILDSRGPFSHDSDPSKKSALAFPAPRDLLSTLKADFAISLINGAKNLMGHAREPQEGIALVEYLRLRKLTDNMTSVDFAADLPDLHYQPGFQSVKAFLFIPLSQDGEDFVVYFQESNPGHFNHEIAAWGEADLRNAAIMRVVYCKFSSVWKERDSALQESSLYKLLLSNSSHEFRTLLNAIANYLEFAGEGRLDTKANDGVKMAKATSQSLLTAVTKLLDFVDEGLKP